MLRGRAYSAGRPLPPVPVPGGKQGCSQWTVASRHRRGVHWEPFGSRIEAQERYDQLGTMSKVLFSPDGVALSCCHAADAGDGDVAAIVRAFVGPSGAPGAPAGGGAGKRAAPGAATTRLAGPVLLRPGCLKRDTAQQPAATPAPGGGCGLHCPSGCCCSGADGHGQLGRKLKASDIQEDAKSPREWSSVVRWGMKHVCRMTFNRSTVAYFGAGPLRLKSMCYFDVAKSPGVHGYVALTLDDAPCRQGPEQSQVPAVLALLRRYGAKATFMTIGDFIEGHEGDLVQLLREGHELGNHGMLDRPYHRDDQEQFAEAVEECSCRIRALQRQADVPEGVAWFRSPHGKYTKAMAATLESKGLTNVMCDTYASCPIVQDGKWIGDFLASQAQHGSIVLIHMPEGNLREWCLTGLERLLDGLHRRGLRVVTVSELAELAGGEGRQ